MTCWPEGGPGLEPGTDMFGIAGTAELSTFCPGTGTWNRLQDGSTTRGGSDILIRKVRIVMRVQVVHRPDMRLLLKAVPTYCRQTEPLKRSLGKYATLDMTHVEQSHG